MTEKCARCGHGGEDRRTLWMKCFYAMEELKIPFEEKVLFNTADHAQFQKFKEPTKLNLGDGRSVVLDGGTVTTDYELTPHKLYTLRVCKRCRAEWLNSIRTWFFSAPEGEDSDATDEVEKKVSVGSGIFVRRNGSMVEITDEEWYELNPYQEPVRWKPGKSD